MTTTADTAAPAPYPDGQPSADTIHGGASRLDTYRDFATKVLRDCESNPGIRSALRSGLRKDLDSIPRMHRFIAPLVPRNATEDTQRAYYAVAAMIAEQARRTGAGAGADDKTAAPATAAEAGDTAGHQPASGEGDAGTRTYGTSLGAAFAQAVIAGPGRERQMRRGTAENRLNLLCKQSVAGLHRHLPASVRYLRSLDAPVDWGRLLQDLIDWPRHSGRISRRWLQDFYRRCEEANRHEAEDNDTQELTAPDSV